ncbi:DNA damage-inducible transcript 3 protein [Protopterus annectens]|uniref:DNA damage-inducible transcript 3 protein n=1 Tax=Protopterus annectens TaxID=7888 RepID=UPI001CFB22F9|nr:DNA damage-inducible transcript 3 protein [Protopterus annectens]
MTGRDKLATAMSSTVFPFAYGGIPEWEMDALYEDLKDILTADSDTDGLVFKSLEWHQKDDNDLESLQSSLIWPSSDDKNLDDLTSDELTLVPSLEELLPAEFFELTGVENQGGQQHNCVSLVHETVCPSVSENGLMEGWRSLQCNYITTEYEQEYPSAPETEIQTDCSKQWYSCLTSASEDECPSAPESDSISSPSPQKLTDDDMSNDRRNEMKRKRKSQMQGGKKSRKEKEEENEHKVLELTAKNEKLQEEIKRLTQEVEATRKALIERMVSLQRK